ncbi:MAG TPA: glycoside hydrolase family 27 protein [Puia sp.]|jgi:alpha-galactosidase|nr:glycoside hydrolase family 27 protein [Puia sp.]
MKFFKAPLLIFLSLVFFFDAFPQGNESSANGKILTGRLAPTPPMGFNTWNTFQTKISEDMLREMVDVFISSGMRESGYQYFVLDDGWMAMDRDQNGSLVADPVKFPHGMKAFADYVHSKGLKFGIYNCAGSKTCAGYPGTRGHEYEDARLYASWGVDFLKYDWCNTDSLNTPEAYKTMSAALRATGRPIVFSICEWGGHAPWLWAGGVGELYRTTGDITPSFISNKNYGNWEAQSVISILDKQIPIRKYNGPNHWNDPDMLEVGNGMSFNEDKSHFSLWCMLSAPLAAGNDLRKMSPQTRDILTNKEMIAIDQDARGISAFKMIMPDSLEMWVKPLKNNELAICFLNRTGSSKKISLDWKDLNISDAQSGLEIHFDNQYFSLRDLWLKKDAGKTDKKLMHEIASHEVIVFKLVPSMK